MALPHERLDCFRASIELARLCDNILADAGSKHAKLRDNLQRSTEGLPLLIAEGANRWSVAQKRQRFIEARGEVGEAHAALLLGKSLGLFDDRATQAMELCTRIYAMLTALSR